MDKFLKYPFQEVPVRAALTEEEWLTFAQTELAAGLGKAPTQVPQAFLDRQKAQSSSGPAIPNFEPPDWVRKLIAAKQTPATVLDMLEKRVNEEPSESRLRETLMLLNEIGSLPDGAKLVQTKVTQQAINQLRSKRR